MFAAVTLCANVGACPAVPRVEQTVALAGIEPAPACDQLIYLFGASSPDADCPESGRQPARAMRYTAAMTLFRRIRDRFFRWLLATDNPEIRFR